MYSHSSHARAPAGRLRSADRGALFIPVGCARCAARPCRACRGLRGRRVDAGRVCGGTGSRGSAASCSPQSSGRAGPARKRPERHRLLQRSPYLPRDCGMQSSRFAAPIGWSIIDRWPPTGRLMIRPCTLQSRPRDSMELRVHANADREDRMCKLVGAQKTGVAWYDRTQVVRGIIASQPTQGVRIGSDRHPHFPLTAVSYPSSSDWRMHSSGSAQNWRIHSSGSA